MSALTPLQPDTLYCVYCHQPAAGPCAICQALICADCAELTGGAVKRVAVCRPCFKAGRGRVTYGVLSGVLLAVAALWLWLL